MPKIRRRAYPKDGAIPGAGRRGNARGKNTKAATGGRGHMPNRPRKDK